MREYFAREQTDYFLVLYKGFVKCGGYIVCAVLLSTCDAQSLKNQFLTN